MKLKFKIIPFLISLLLVVGVTFGICWYSLHDYQINKNRFYDDYFHVEDYEDVDSTTLIENAIKYDYSNYKKADSVLSITDFNKDLLGDESATYKDGTIHIPGYFDIDVYLQYSDDGQGTGKCEYYFYFYNVQYTKIANISSPLTVILARGTGVMSEDELEDIEDTDFDSLYGDTLIDKAIDRINDETNTNNGSQNTAVQFSVNSYPVYDNNATNAPTGYNRVWRAPIRNDINNDDIYDEEINEFGTLTFAILSYAKDGTCKELLRGTISDLENRKDSDFKLGANSDILSNDALKSEYYSYIWLRVALHGLIAFVITGVIAVLFYLIWIDTDNTKEEEKQNQPKKKKTTKKKVVKKNK